MDDDESEEEESEEEAYGTNSISPDQVNLAGIQPLDAENTVTRENLVEDTANDVGDPESQE